MIITRIYVINRFSLQQSQIDVDLIYLRPDKAFSLHPAPT